jgi:outer membrane protein OmpA-like peptidoglycan-associated protein
MKKVFITMVALLAVSSSVMAAGHVDSVRYLTTKAWKNWFISADGNVDWWKGSDKNPAGNYTDIQWGKPSFGGNINVGKWLNHCIGLRLSYDVNGGKSYINGLYVGRPLFHFLYDGKFNFDENGNLISYDGSAPDENGYYNTSFVYHNLHGDVLFSPIDFFQGYYNPNRIWTPVIYLGMGVASVSEGILINPNQWYNWQHKGETITINGRQVGDEKGINYEFSAAAGLINNFRLGNHLDLHLDLKWSAQRWNIDSWFYEPANQQGGWVYPDGTPAQGNISNEAGQMPTYYNRHRIDQNLSVGLGLTYYFSREYDLPKDCPEIMEKNDSIIKVIETVHDTIVKFVNTNAEDVLSYPFSIFFNRDSYQLMSRRDIVNLREIAKVAKDNGYKLLLTGSCDSATATPAYNQTLSENRCNKIKVELLELGVPEDQIVIEPIGGVKILDPTEYDRRVLIQLLKEADK